MNFQSRIMWIFLSTIIPAGMSGFLYLATAAPPYETDGRLRTALLLLLAGTLVSCWRDIKQADKEDKEHHARKYQEMNREEGES